MHERLIFNVEPIGKGRPRFTRTGHAYTPAKTQKAERIISIIGKMQWKHEPLTCPVEVKVTFYMPRPKAKQPSMVHIKRPDLDNILKLVLDALNGIVWADDNVIWHIDAQKIYSNEPRIELDIYT